MTNLFAELRRRNVFRVAGVYLVVGWLAIQVVANVAPILGLPAWFGKAVIVLLGVGFPIAVLFAWAFEMTPEGVKLTANVPESQSIVAKTGRKLDYAILGGLALAIIFVVADRLMPETAAPAAVATGTEAAPAQADDAPPAASIAVLPFADLSPAGDQQYFSQGIAEEILNVLAKVSGLEVASRTSSFQFKGQEKIGIPLIAEQLHVRHILEGSVRKAGDTIRITAQLIDAETDKHLWSETFDRTLTTDNIFAVQDEITKAIVEQLSRRIKGASAIATPAARSADTENADAYALFLEGQTLFVMRGEANILRSIAALEGAVEIDPGFARAWAVLAADYSIAKGWFSGANLNRDFDALADDAARKAIELDPSLSLPYAVLGAKSVNTTDYEGAFSNFDKAIARNPKDETIFMWRAEVWRDLGFFDKAIADFDRCLSLNPDYGNCRDHKSNAQMFAGDFDAGRATYNETLRRGFDPGGNPGQWAGNLHRGETGVLLYQLHTQARTLAGGDMRWAVDMFYQSMTNPDYDREEALRILEARLAAMGSPLAPGSFGETGALFLLRAYDRMHPTGDSWWWATTSFPEWKASPERKRLMRERGLDVYWREHGFPPQCRAVGKDDFACE